MSFRRFALSADPELVGPGSSAPRTDALRTVAAVDLGSNSFHMIVAEGDASAYRVLDRVKETVRLAVGLTRTGQIDAAARARALDCLARFGERLRGLAPERVRVVGTNTLRAAVNAGAFIEQAGDMLGYPIEIISGAEEARLIYAGVAQDLDAKRPRRLVVDIGGGSTELIAGCDGAPELVDSIPVGAVVQSERFFGDSRVTGRGWRDAVLETQVHLEPIARRYRARGWDVAIGASGSIKAIAQAANEATGPDQIIEAGRLWELAASVARCGTQAPAFQHVAKDRRAIFPGGLAVLTGVFESLGIEAMSASDKALREGVVGDLLGRLAARDGRETGVAVARRTYGVDADHAERVAATCDSLLVDIDAGAAARQRGRWAAQLHEVGMAIAMKGYHKHGEYILKKADLPGFSRDEQRLLAAVVRLHRGKFRRDCLDALPHAMRDQALTLAVVLRLAALIHRSRDPETRWPVRLARAGNDFVLGYADDWLSQRPLTQADFAHARARLDAAGIGLRLEANA